VLGDVYRKRFRRVVAVLILAAIPLACAAPEPSVQNPFLGTWTTADNDSVTIRQDTVVQKSPDANRLDRPTA